jgi:hypothetical protein
MLRFPSNLSRVVALAMALSLSNLGNGAEAMPDRAITTYGVLNPAAPAELGMFAFLIGKWTGTARSRNPDGTFTEYQFDWIGRYALDGMAIADEIRMSSAEGGAIQGMSLRFFDAARTQWAIEFLNFNRSFLRRQVGSEWGEVTQEGSVITINQDGPGGIPGREVYTLIDDDRFTYSMDFTKEDGQTWDEGIVMMEMKREEGP